MGPRTILLALLLSACTGHSTTHPPPHDTTAPPAPAPAPAPAPVPVPVPPPAPTDPDGNDDPVDDGGRAPQTPREEGFGLPAVGRTFDTGSGPFPDHAHFERVGKPPLSLWRICHLTPFHGALYAAHAYLPLDMDGATVSRYDPSNPAQPFTVAFDWNRPGEPARNGGAGQGFLRVRAIGGRLFVPDTDPPYNGFEITEPGTEGYVFVSDRAGVFAPPKMPHHRPPDAPDAEGRAGAAILPRAYHVIDVIRYRGRIYASTGSVPPGQRAWHGPSPGALHVASDDLSRWTFAVDYPSPWEDGGWRMTFLVRFEGRLYAGLQDYDGTEPNDYLVFDPPPFTQIGHASMRAVRVTARGTARTLRWYADQGRLYWIAWSREGVRLRVTEDGDRWTLVDLPKDAGRPSDVKRFRGVPVALTERGLYRLDRDPPERVAKAPSPDGRTPFEVHNTFCAAPLAVLGGELYAGGQRDGALYRVVADR